MRTHANEHPEHYVRRFNQEALGTTADLEEFLFGSEASDPAEPMLELLRKTYRQRGFGDYLQHMMVAMGKGEFCVDFNIKPWDIAPLKVILEEAGGRCTDTSGIAHIYGGNAVCSNGLLHDEIIQAIYGLT